MIRAGDVETDSRCSQMRRGASWESVSWGTISSTMWRVRVLHACIYLFTVDIDMEPLSGFKLTSWEKGYGDMQMVPDMGTLRLIPGCRTLPWSSRDV